MEKTYSPGDIEQKWYEHWEGSGAFKCNQRPDAETFSIVIPPPNVTGSLHVGHALNNTLQDILARFERLRGKDVLWQPGTDHAGIATQMVVERQLAAQGKTRHDLGREGFIKRVWEWKEESGGTITRQLRRLGSSCDWSRERFTMDEGLSAAVLKVFVQYYREGLIYRDKRLVNWDPKFKTAISDLEVEQREVQGHFWHLRYPVKGEDGRFIEVATTRPETMLGDTAVAVHPEDDRYTDLVGKTVILPLVGREIPIVADEHADPEQGSGAVKITPAHDFNDFEVGKRHDLPQENIFDENAHINDNAPEKYRGMERFEARKAIVADLEAQGFLVAVEDKVIQMPYGDRSGVVIEPWLTDQWYVDAKRLAVDALKAVDEGRTTFHPANWKKTYDEWLTNIQPWCISRQLWWGHQIPAWFTPDGEIFVAESEAEAYDEARAKHGDDVVLTRDADVLDTWFSSALWPFSTLGWPEQTQVLKRFYPTSTLITAFDIIFFWVARMMMSGLHFMNEVPFKDVYITSLVRDANGQKMSKSKGNVIDPLDFIEKYGADALRFTMSSMESQGRDIKLSEDRVEGYRNFGTKLWNATRFAQMNGIGGSDSLEPPAATLTVNKWIIGQTAQTVATLTKALQDFRFDAASAAIYQFTWRSFCDWYLELIKPVLQDDASPEAEKAETRAVAGWVLDQIFVMLHPFMPFITEELWHATSDTRATDLILAQWPTVKPDVADATAVDDIEWVISFIRDVRSTRSEMNVPAGAKVAALLVGADETVMDRVRRNEAALLRLARLSEISAVDAAPESGAIQLVVEGLTVALPVADIMDLAAERDRLAKSAEKVEKEIRGLEGRLGNDAFIAKAPEAVVAEAREQLADRKATLTKLHEARARLG